MHTIINVALDKMKFMEKAQAADAERFRFLMWLADETIITVEINRPAIDNMMEENTVNGERPWNDLG